MTRLRDMNDIMYQMKIIPIRIPSFCWTPYFPWSTLKPTIFQWLNHVKSQFLRLKPWFFRYFPWWNQGFHLIFHGFPWLNPPFSLVEWGTHSFPWLNPSFSHGRPLHFSKGGAPGPRGDRPSGLALPPCHGGAVSRNAAKEWGQRGAGAGGKMWVFFPWFFYRFFPWKIEVFQGFSIGFCHEK